MQRFAAPFAFLFLVVVLTQTQSAQAQQTEYPGGYTLMPLNPGKIALLSMTVDVNFHDDGEITTAEVQVSYRLHNRDKGTARSMQVAVPGYPAPKPAPNNINLQLNGKELKLKPGNQQWWLAKITLQPNKRANLVMTYSAKVGEGALAHFRYPMDLTGKLWPGRLESARFTISFPEPPNPQSWITLTPENYQLSAEAVTWSYDLKDPKEPIDFLFIRPSLWEDIQEARREAARSQSPEAYKKLGAIYAQLATAIPNPDIFERYYPLAVASYAQAQQLNPRDNQTYLALAQLYQLRAEVEPEESAAYTSLAINELSKALEHGANDPDIRNKVVDGILALAARARARGDFDAANTYLQRLEELAQANPDLINNQAIPQERQALAVEWARQVFEREGSAPARAVLAQIVGPEVLNPPNAQYAQLNSLYVRVQTQPYQRLIDINAALREGDLTIMNELAAALARTDVAQIEIQEGDPVLLHIAINFADPEDLLNRQRILAEAIPPRPEWALLRAILLPVSLDWQRIDERWRTVERYDEHISLVDVSADAGLQALSLERAANRLDTTKALDGLLADIWRREAQLWRDLATNSRTRFTLTLYPRPGAPLKQTWSAVPGEDLRMTGEVKQYHLGAILLTALGAYLLFALVTWLIYRFVRRDA